MQRHQIGRVQDVRIVEQSYSPFVKFDLAPVDKVRLVTGARGDVFSFDVHAAGQHREGDLNGR